MATTTFTGIPEVGYSYDDRLPAITFKYAGTGVEQRATLQGLSRRRYVWPMRKTSSVRQTHDAFFLARSWTVEAFYVRDPKDASRTGVSLGTATSNQTVFTLPTTGNESRFYPVASATYTVYDDAVSATVSTMSQDSRTFTLSAAPASGSVMTVDFIGYRLCRLQDAFSWRMLAPDWFECQPVFMEVVE